MGDETETPSAETPEPTCGVCGAKGKEAKVQPCCNCGGQFCKEHYGQEGASYWSFGGRKGHACSSCLEHGLAFEGGKLYELNQASAALLRISHDLPVTLAESLLPKVMADVDQRVSRIINQDIPNAIQKSEEIRAAVVAVGQTLEKLDGVLASLRRTIIVAGVSLGAFVAAGIIVAALVVKVL